AGEVRQRPAGGDRLDDPGGRPVAARDVVRRHRHRPLLGGGRLLPVGVGQLLEKNRGLFHLRLELLGERFSRGSHECPPRTLPPLTRRTRQPEIDIGRDFLLARPPPCPILGAYFASG